MPTPPRKAGRHPPTHTLQPTQGLQVGVDRRVAQQQGKAGVDRAAKRAEACAAGRTGVSEGGAAGRGTMPAD